MSVIVFKTALSVVLCPAELRDAINDSVDILPVCEVVTVDDEVYLAITFDVALSSEENGELETLIEEFECETDETGGELPDTGTGMVISHDSVPLVVDVETLDFTGCVAVEQPDSLVPLARANVGSKKVENNTGALISKFTPVYMTGVNTDGYPTIGIADNSISSQMPAVGILRDDIAATEQGLATISGEITGLDTSSFSVGDNLYVGAAGSITNTRPTGASTFIQKIAQVAKADAVNGAVLVFGAGRSNDVPNITTGKVWMGDNSGVAQETSVYTETEVDTFISSVTTQLTNHDHSMSDLSDVSGTPVSGDVLQYNGTNWVPQEPTGGSGGLTGTLYTLVYVYESNNVKNRWLSHQGGNSNHSYQVPGICPWASELVAMTFSNKDNDADTNIKLYSSPEGSGSSDSFKYNWTIYNARTARKTDISGVSFSAGEKIGVYLQDCGADPDLPVVTLYFKITNDTAGEYVETWSGCF